MPLSDRDIQRADATLNSPMPDTLRHYLIPRIAEALAEARAQAETERDAARLRAHDVDARFDKFIAEIKAMRPVVEAADRQANKARSVIGTLRQALGQNTDYIGFTMDTNERVAEYRRQHPTEDA